VTDERATVSLGEGQTPPVAAEWVARELGLASVAVKLESLNPTLSYKDRTNAVAVAAARQFGYDRICCTSSGNHGVSMAAYASAAGLRSLVLFPPDAPPSVVAEVRHYGGDAVLVEADGTAGSPLAPVDALHRRYGWFISNRNAPLATGRPFGNPFGLEGYKTIAYEIHQQLGGRTPTWCCVPVGGGDGLAGVWRGFRELVDLGLAATAPRMVACQPEAGDSVVAAWRAGRSEVVPVVPRPTIALSLVDRLSGDHALRAVRESHGRAVAVPDEAIRDAGEELGRHGIAIEPSSAAALAGLRALAKEGALQPGETAVVLGTGAGLRWPATYDRIGAANVPRIPPELTALQGVVRL
jgi:threonine synthase